MGGDSGSRLEMRCADEAWYDGTLRFASDAKDKIIVHFNDFPGEEDEMMSTSFLLDPKKLRLRVRVRSEQLQDNQCKLVNEDQLICGCLDDGDARRYYDAQVVSIAKKEHVYYNGGEDCKCNFKLHWLDGPKKGKQTVVGCAEVCFLSNDAPEDDIMVKNLVKSLAGNGEQRRKPAAAPKTVPSPRPRTPSPRLEIALSKKQASKDPSPTSLELPSRKKLSSSKDPSSTSLELPSRKKLSSSKDPSPTSVELPSRKKSSSSKDASPTSVELPSRKKLSSSKDPSPTSVELPSRKKLSSSKDNPPTSTLPKQRVQLGQEADAKSVGSKKKRIVQGEEMEEQPDRVTDNDDLGNLDTDARPTSTPEDRSCEVPEDVRGHSNVNDDSERRGRSGESTKKGSEKKRLVKSKNLKAGVTRAPEVVVRDEAAAVTPEVVVRDEAAAVRQEEEDDVPRPAPKRLKSNTKSLATPDVAAPCEEAAVVTKDYDVVTRPFKWRVKTNTLEKKKIPDDAAGARVEAPVVIEDDDIPLSSSKEDLATPDDVDAVRDKAVSLTCGERVKLKSLEKSKSVEASPQKEKPEVIPRRSAAHKVSLQNVGKQTVGEQMENNHKQVQLDSRLSSKPDEATRPGTLSRPKDVAEAELEPEEHLQEPTEQQTQKGGKPKQPSLRKPVKQSLPSKKQPVRRCSKERRRNSQQEEIIDTVIAEKQTSSNPATKKQRLEEPLAVTLDTDDINSHKSRKEGVETLDELQQARGKKERRRRKPLEPHHHQQQQPPQSGDDEGLPEKSKSADNDKHQAPLIIENLKRPSTQPNQQTEREDAHTSDNNNNDNNEGDIPVAATHANTKRLGKASITETCHDIDMRCGSNRQPSREYSVEKTSEPVFFEAVTPGSSSEVEELTASPPPRVSKKIQENVRVADNRAPRTRTEVIASGKKRRRNLVVVTDDEENDDDVQAPAKNLKSSKNVKSAKSIKDVKNLDVQNLVTDAEEDDNVQAPAKNLKNSKNVKSVKRVKDVKNLKRNVEEKGKEMQRGSAESAANSQDECGDPKATSTSALDEERNDEVKATTRLLMLSNMEPDVSAHDAMLLLQAQTEGVCAVHVLPVAEFQSSTVGYALYRDSGSALKAFVHLSSTDRFVVSPNGRPWIVSQSTDTYGPHLCGFAARTAFKSDDPGVCGIISDQPPIQELIVVTKEGGSSKAYSQALQRSKKYAEYQRLRKELHERMVLGEL